MCSRYDLCEYVRVTFLGVQLADMNPPARGSRVKADVAAAVMAVANTQCTVAAAKVVGCGEITADSSGSGARMQGCVLQRRLGLRRL